MGDEKAVLLFLALVGVICVITLLIESGLMTRERIDRSSVVGTAFSYSRSSEYESPIFRLALRESFG